MNGRWAALRASGCVSLALLGGVTLALWRWGAPSPDLRVAALLALWSFLVALDERALGPLIFHQPVVAAGLAGYILGQPLPGLWAGVVMQAIWPGLLPLGAARQPQAGLGALIWVLWLAMPPASGIWPLGMACGLLAAAWGMRAEGWLRRRNARRAPHWRERLGDQIGAGLLEAGCVGPFGVVLFYVLPALALARLQGILPAWPGPALDAGRLALFALGGFVGDRTLHSMRLWRGRHPLRAVPAETQAPAAPAVPRLGMRRFLALLTLQAAFSNEYLQRAGFLRMLNASPAWAGADPSPKVSLAVELMEHGMANTQPILAAALVGALDRVLYDARETPPPRSPVRLIELGGSILAQWGDRVVWGAVRPLGGLLILALLPLAPGLILIGYLLLALTGGFAARLGFYRWGWRAGWDLVRGGASWAWRRGPAVLEAAAVPVGLVAALAFLLGYASLAPPGGALASWSRALLWFMVGFPCGALLARRPTFWGWACWVVGILPG